MTDRTHDGDEPRLAPHIERTLDPTSIATLTPNRWGSIMSTHGVPAPERDFALRIRRLAVEAARELAVPRPVPSAVVRLEPRERSPGGPWAGVLAAGPGLFRMDEPELRAFLADVRDRLVAHRSGVRAWLPDAGVAEPTVAVRVPEGLPLWLAPFVVTDPDTLAELETAGLPDSALPVPVLRLPIKE